MKKCGCEKREGENVKSTGPNHATVRKRSEGGKQAMKSWEVSEEGWIGMISSCDERRILQLHGGWGLMQPKLGVHGGGLAIGLALKDKPAAHRKLCRTKQRGR